MCWFAANGYAASIARTHGNIEHAGNVCSLLQGLSRYRTDSYHVSHVTDITRTMRCVLWSVSSLTSRLFELHLKRKAVGSNLCSDTCR
jgi:hypothetical protein